MHYFHESPQHTFNYTTPMLLIWSSNWLPVFRIYQDYIYSRVIHLNESQRKS